MYIESSGRAFSSSLIVSERGPIAIGLRTVFCVVQTVFLMILGSEVVEGTSFSFYIVLGTGVHLDLHRIILEDRQ